MREKDITQKDFFTDEKRFADFVNAVFFHGRKILKAEELKGADTAVRKADEAAVLERTCDVVKKQAKDGAVYTIVVYWGENEWDAVKSLREMVDIPVEDEELRYEMLELLPDYKIKVFDLNKETDFTAFGTTLKTVFEFYGARKDKNELKNYMDTHKKEVENLDKESKFFLATMLGQKRLGKKLLKRSNQKEEGSMCKAIDDMIEDGRAEGRAESEHIIQQLRKEAEQTILLLKKENDEKERQLIKLKQELKKLSRELAIQE